MIKYLAVVLVLVVSFTVPVHASSLSQVLAWKYASSEGVVPPGISTKENKKTGAMEIRNWPAAKLGLEPTAEQIGTWTREYDALPPKLTLEEATDEAINSATTLEELKSALVGRIRHRRR